MKDRPPAPTVDFVAKSGNADVEAALDFVRQQGSQQAPLAPDLWLGQLIGAHFRVESELGRGAMGVVFKANDENLKRPVALKKILLQNDPAALARFQREAELTAKAKHANFVA